MLRRILIISAAAVAALFVWMALTGAAQPGQAVAATAIEYGLVN
jgi:hypothetical protein